MLGHNTRPMKFKRIKTIQSMFSELYISNRYLEDSPSVGKLSTLPSNQRVKEEITEK